MKGYIALTDPDWYSYLRSCPRVEWAADFESMVHRISQLRGDVVPSARTGDFEIGCVMISAPVFFGKRWGQALSFA